MEAAGEVLSKQGKLEVQEKNEGRIYETLTCCPECKKKGIISSVKRKQYEQDRYWVACTRLDDGLCFFLEELEGNLCVTKEDLIIYGFPDQLSEHMDIYYQDIGKISRLCMSEYIKTKYLGSTTTFLDLCKSVKMLSEAHGFSFTQPKETIKTVVCDIRANEDFAKTVTDPHGLQSVHDCKQPTKASNECEPTLQGELVGPLDLEELFSFNLSSLEIKKDECENQVKEELVETITNLEDFYNPSQLFQPTEENKYHLTGNDDIENMFQHFDCSVQSLQPMKSNDKELTCLEDEGNETIYKITFDSMREFAESLVEDLPIHYQERVKIAFSKIRGYNFPEDYINKMNTLDEIPLFKVLEQREREERVKSEMEEQLQDFMAEMDGIKELLQ